MYIHAAVGLVGHLAILHLFSLHFAFICCLFLHFSFSGLFPLPDSAFTPSPGGFNYPWRSPSFHGVPKWALDLVGVLRPVVDLPRPSHPPVPRSFSLCFLRRCWCVQRWWTIPFVPCAYQQHTRSPSNKLIHEMFENIIFSQ